MRKHFLFLSVVLCALALGFTACSDDDNDNVKQDKVPAQVRETFSQMYPSAAPTWEMEYGMYKAEWHEGGDDIDAWFMPNGDWKCTDRNMRRAGLPEAVTNYINTNYAGYYVDDVDYMEVPGDSYYDIELERNGYPDVELWIRADGTVINEGFEPWKGNDGDVTWGNVPQAVKNAFQSMFPGVNAEWEIERGRYKAEWEVKGIDYEAWFEADGTWLRTKQDVPVSALPAAVINYVQANYPGYYIDDADLVETPTDKYYLLELDKNGAADIYLKITAEGSVIA